MHQITNKPKLSRPAASVLKQSRRRRSPVNTLKQLIQRRPPASILKFSSIVFTIAGGMLLALNIEASRYGFLFLAGGSGQLLLSSWLRRDRSMIIYSLSLFVFVDCLGVWRWLLN